ncbi:DoxX family membrane protein [Croceicoccus sp. F390]|uniref:DoxX family membrane protein n=1 Tax=Croceicoccus esteveae TaxID=3075597 RepID=A0ABU2ZET9_9SPHN|nr:DoxX family membrane protein [Croceicoccus sp. F390]MDT0574905.1 DoxX family membrane protein [Croceicoccus sp. F390]
MSSRWRTTARWLLGPAYVVAGILHLAVPEPFLQIMPDIVPAPKLVILATGVAEIAGGLALLQNFFPPIRKAAAWGLAIYAVCVFPANINHFAMDMARVDHGLGLAYHIPRMLLQPLLVWLVLWAGQIILWPQRLPDKHD